MEVTLDKKQLNLLSRLSRILKDPDTSSLLDTLERQEPLPPDLPSPSLAPQPTKLSLLERLNGSISSRISRSPLIPSGTNPSRKHPRSPQSPELLGRTLMSRLLNHKRSRHSTPILQKSSPSCPLSTKTRTRKILPQILQIKSHPPLPTSQSKSLGETETHLTQEMNQMETLADDPREENSLSPTCLGLQNRLSLPLATPVAKKPVGFCESLIETSPQQNSLSKSPTIHLQGSPPLNGNASSKVTPSTSTKSSRRSTILSLMKREQAAWATRRSLLGSLNRRNESPLLLNGLQPGEKRLKQLHSPSHIDTTNYSNTETTSKRNSRLKLSPHITKSFSMTQPCETRSPPANTFSSPTTTDSADCTQPLSCPMELNPCLTDTMVENQEKLLTQVGNQKSVTSSMPERARTLSPTANIDISAKPATNRGTEKGTARMGANEIYGLQPKYLRHNLWDQSSTLSPTTAEWSETAQPLPRPSPSNISNPFAVQTIANNPDLFQILTPIKVDVFESLLQDHPNPEFVKSVCDGLGLILLNLAILSHTMNLVLCLPTMNMLRLFALSA